MATYHGSCLCQKVAFEVVGAFDDFFFCHCSRCRKVTGTNHASNLFSNDAEFKWVRGQEFVKKFKLENARFTKSFCINCGSAMPTLKEGGRLLVPAGSLDSEVDTPPTGHIQMSSKANWEDSIESAPRYEVYP